MEKELSTDAFTTELAKRNRVILLGGMAMIAHGLNRPTKDLDIWLEPFSTAEEWVERCLAVVAKFPGSHVWSLAERRRLDRPEEIVADIDDFSVIRIGGMDMPLDIFRKPNELDMDEFDSVWAAASSMESGLRLPEETDLYRTNANTGRPQDLQDQLFLESLVRERFRARLPVCDLAEAKSLTDRFLDPQTLANAKTNPHPEVRAHALRYLKEFEAEGDPYSRDILSPKFTPFSEKSAATF